MDNIDKIIGAKIRNRRHVLGISQNDLASKVGITFQQIQKYEKGQNKITATRLLELAQIMNIDINYFFEDIKLQSSIVKEDNSMKQDQASFIYQEEVIDNNEPIKKDTIRLIKFYNRIENKHTKRKLLQFIKSMVTDEE